MAGSSVSISISNFPEQEVLRLPEHDRFIGVLLDIIEPDGEDFVFACFAEQVIEVPKSLAPALWPLVGQKTIIGHFDGKYRAGVSTT